MPDRWKDRLARVDLAIDRVMAETVRIVPVVEGDFGGATADPARPAFEVDAVVTIRRGETDLGGNAQHLRNVQVRTAAAEAQIERSRLPAIEIRKGDRLVALDQGLVFRIERLDTEHAGRLALELSADRSGAVT